MKYKFTLTILIVLATIGCAHTGYDRSGECECICTAEDCEAQCSIHKDSEYDFKVNKKEGKKK